MKKRLICLLGFFSLITAGCATTTPQSFYPPLPEDRRTQIRSVAVGPASFTPTGHFFTYAKGRPPGTTNRAAEGAILGAAMGGAEAANSNLHLFRRGVDEDLQVEVLNLAGGRNLPGKKRTPSGNVILPILPINTTIRSGIDRFDA
jgi:hypothetical protein